MITLCVENYCQTCPYFEEDVEHESLWGNGEFLPGHIYIRCGHRKICKRIANMTRGKDKNSEVEKRGIIHEPR